MLCRFDSAYYGHAAVSAALTGGAEVSVTVRMGPAVKRAITGIPETARKTIEYIDAVFGETTNTGVSKAEVAETVFTAFSSRKKGEQITGRLVVRRIPELNPKATDRQPTLFETHRHHAFFTTVNAAGLNTVGADKTHRKHAIIEQVNADLKDSALAHLPSGVFAANSAWLVAAGIAYNFTRAAGILAAGHFGKARTGTIRRKLIHVPARIATSARRIRLHLPESWLWPTPWQCLSDHLQHHGRPYSIACTRHSNPPEPPSTQPHGATGNHQWNTQGQRGPAPRHARCPHNEPKPDPAHQPRRIGGSRLSVARIFLHH